MDRRRIGNKSHHVPVNIIYTFFKFQVFLFDKVSLPKAFFRCSIVLIEILWYGNCRYLVGLLQERVDGGESFVPVLLLLYRVHGTAGPGCQAVLEFSIPDTNTQAGL